VGDLRDMAAFADKLRVLARDGSQRFEGFAYDVEARPPVVLARWGPPFVAQRRPTARMRAQADIERYAGIARRVLPFVGDTVEYVNDAYEAGRRILIEGANATMLDLDFGTYPYVTSSNPSIGGVACGLGLAPSKFGAIIGVVRAPRGRGSAAGAPRTCA